MEHIIVITRRLPQDVRGITVPNDDGSWSIFICDTLSDYKRKEVLLHELEDIFGDDFWNADKDADSIEYDSDDSQAEYCIGDHVLHYMA